MARYHRNVHNTLFIVMVWQLKYFYGTRSMADEYYRAYSVKRIHRPPPPPTLDHLRASLLNQFQEKGAQEDDKVKEEQTRDRLGLTTVELDDAMASNNFNNTRDLMATLVETVSPVFVFSGVFAHVSFFVFVMLRPLISSFKSMK